MKLVLASSVALVSVAGAAGTLQGDIQDLINQQASNTSAGLQFSWKSATESFTIAAGNVTNPGEASRAIRTDDTFNYGSGTKAVVATAIMRMADAGKINIRDKVSPYVNPYLKRNNGTTLEELYGSQMADATILHVLRMEAGIPDFEHAKGGGDIDSDALNSDGQVFPPYAWMRAASNQSAICNPGNCSFYSSNSYEVAGVLLAALQNPAGDWNDLDFAKTISDDPSRYPSMKLRSGAGKLKDTVSVAGVSKSRDSNTTVMLWDQDATIMGWTCGGMMTNTGDFANFFYDLLAPSSTNRLVSDAALKDMANLTKLSVGYFRVDYGAGLMDSAAPVYNQPTNKTADDWSYIIGHIGETFAFHAMQGYMPKAKAAMSVVTNTDAGRHAIDYVACKASEIAAKYAGEIIDLNCTSSSPSYGRRRRTTQKQLDIVV